MKKICHQAFLFEPAIGQVCSSVIFRSQRRSRAATMIFRSQATLAALATWQTPPATVVQCGLNATPSRPSRRRWPGECSDHNRSGATAPHSQTRNWHPRAAEGSVWCPCSSSFWPGASRWHRSSCGFLERSVMCCVACAPQPPARYVGCTLRSTVRAVGHTSAACPIMLEGHLPTLLQRWASRWCLCP